MKVWFDPAEWQAGTRGRSCQFLATDQDVYDLLNTTLVELDAPYTIIGYENTKERDRFHHVTKECGISVFLSLRAEGFRYFFIRSLGISPDMDLSRRRFVDQFLAVNGLIQLSHGSINTSVGWAPSAIALVNKIARKTTGDLFVHEDYEKVFSRLRQAVKGMPGFKVLRRRPDEREVEETQIHMTADFANKLRSGEIESAYYPGDPL